MNKIILYGLGVLSFFIAVSFYLRTYDSCQIKLTLLQLGGGVIVGLWLIKLALAGKIYLSDGKRKIFLVLLLFLAWGFISFLLTDYKWIAWQELLKRFIYTGIFGIILLDFGKEECEKLGRYLLWAWGIVVFYGLIQYFDIRYFPIKETSKGLDPFLWRQAWGGRIFSTFGNPKFFSDFVLLSFPVIISYLSGNIFIILAGAISVFLIHISHSFCTQSGFVLGILLYLFAGSRYINNASMRSKTKRIFTEALLVICFLAVAAFFIRARNTDDIKCKKATWGSTLEMIRKKPVAGWGIGSFLVVYPEYRKPVIMRIQGKHNTEQDHAGNEYLELWSDEGIVGLLLFIGFLYLLFANISRRVGEIKKIEVSENNCLLNELSNYGERINPLIPLGAFLFAYCIGIGYEGVSHRFVGPGFYFWLVSAMALSIVFRENQEAEISVRRELRFCLLSFGLAVIVFSVLIPRRLFLADLHHNKAVAYSKAGIWDKAIKEYLTVIKYNPGYVMTHYFMGNVFNDRWEMKKQYSPEWGDKDNIERTDAERALQKYEDVKKLAPNYVQTHFQVGVVYNKLEMWDEAIENFKKAVKLDPVFPQNYFRLGWAYVRKGDWENAEKTFRESIRQKPEEADGYINLGNVYFTEKKYKEAEEVYLMALDLAPESQNAYKNLYSFYESTGRLQDFKKLIKQRRINITDLH